MSIAALDSTNNSNSKGIEIEGTGYNIRGLSYMMLAEKKDPSDPSGGLMAKKKTKVEDELDSISSGSIGRNSDDDASPPKSDSDDSDDDGVVQSSYKGPLDTLDALEEVLPIRRGISKFYSGKSKSFTNLGDASSSSSIKEIAKPEDGYTRKRKNLLATSLLLNKQHSSSMVNTTGEISKRLTSSKRLTFNLTATPSSSSESITSENSNTSSSSPPPRPPLHPRQKQPSNNNAYMSQPSFSSRRAYSLMDLQLASINDVDESNNRH